MLGFSRPDGRSQAAFLAACDRFDGTTPAPDLVAATSQFLTEAHQAPELLGAVASALSGRSPAAAGWIAVTLGNALEHGADPTVSGRHVLDHFVAELEHLPRPSGPSGDEYPDPTPTQLRHLEPLRFLGPAVVAHLARLPQERERLAADVDLLRRLEDLSAYHPCGAWVHSALRRMSGPLVVIHPPSGAGLLLSVQNVETCFHLFTLVQAAVGTSLPGGREPDPAVVAAAHSPSEERLGDVAWWHFGDPRSPTPQLQASIWGEADVRSLPLIDGHLVMLLWPSLIRRGWSASFFEPHLQAFPPDVVVQRALTPDEARGWLTRLGLPVE